MSKPHIAFFGLGLMGSGMARQLLSAGHSVTVFNRNRDKTVALQAQGATVADSPRDAAKGAGFVVSMVADDTASRSMWLGEEGALAGVAKGTMLIEASTLTVGWVRELAAAANEKGCALLDAPVTGSKTQAATGELNFLVGGSPDTLEKARPVLASMSKSVTLIGPTGSGALLKLINNFLCGVQAASAAEALALIERSGLDRDKAIEFLSNGAPGSPLMKILFQRMAGGDVEPHFRLALMAKDLGYSLQEARDHGLSLHLVAAALGEFKQAIDAGHGDKDFSAIVVPLRQREDASK